MACTTSSLATAEFESTTVRPSIRGVRSISTSVNTTDSARIYGHIRLVAGNNINLTYMGGSTIRIDAIDGAGLNEECECTEAVGQSNVVKSINGIALEDLAIIGDGECIQVVPEGNRLVIKDVCSEPCCGCPELEFLTENLKILDISFKNLQSFADQLSQRINTFVTNFIMMVQ